MVNQNAASRLRQSGSLGGHHTYAIKGEFETHSRAARLKTKTTSEYFSEDRIFPITFSRLIYLPLAIVSFGFWRIDMAGGYKLIL